MNLPLSEKHGVNPSVGHCYFCQKSMEVILFGRLPGDAEAPRDVTLHMEPCPECKKLMELGILIIGVRDGELDKIEQALKEHQAARDEWERGYHPGRRRFRPFLPNPYRTGLWVVAREDAIRRLLARDPQLLAQVLECRWVFVEDTDAEQLGLKEAAKSAPTALDEAVQAADNPPPDVPPAAPETP